MTKGYSDFSDYKNGEGGLKSPSNNSANQNDYLTEGRVQHVLKGDYTLSNRPSGGGHGQDSIDYMEKNNIPYEITKEYTNGVRVGNLPTSINREKRSGNNHTWFPRTWTNNDIVEAVRYVASKYKGTPTPRTSHTEIYKGVRVTIIFGKNGSMSTVFPNKNQGGIKK